MPQIFKVGGCVRDGLLGIDSKDIDFTFVLDNLDQTVEQGFADMTKHLEDNGFEIFLSVPEMFTIRAKFPKGDPNEKLVADFVMARKEIGYIEGTRKPILALGTLHDDLIRRDFTVNSMAIDENGTLIDPFGGVIDLASRLLRTPIDPNITMLDDPLRILRALRFSITKGFTIHDRIYFAMSQPDILEKLRSVVSQERIREELYKMMKYDTVMTIKKISYIDSKILPGFLELVFARGLWLEPTFKK